jgi:chloride channel protein, CIC family
MEWLSMRGVGAQQCHLNCLHTGTLAAAGNLGGAPARDTDSLRAPTFNLRSPPDCGSRKIALATLTRLALIPSFAPDNPNHSASMTAEQPFESSPHSATTDGLTVSPALDLVAEAAHVPVEVALVDGRVVRLSLLAIALGAVAAGASVVLLRLIALITNIAFFQQFSLSSVPPAANQLGAWVVVVPVVGALIVGFIARYGSKAIRGHGIPEAMEQVLTNESRIPARVTFLKPLSAAIAIGTGGPFGAEGPIIATGGALGSMLGQLLSTTATERKTLLAAGAAAGMAATFGSPVSAVLLAVELLLFEYRARSIIPVALACATATGIHFAIDGPGTTFAMPNVAVPSLGALGFYALLGCVMGCVAVLVTRLLYAIEDGFERLSIHWMWWPAIGAVVVGIVGYFAPNTLGVGYYNISDLLAGNMATRALLFLFSMKLISWSISLGSGTSGGTLAPLFTIGGAIGALAGTAATQGWPALGANVSVAALVGMAAMFGGASRAFLASAVFAFETTQQPFCLLPLLAGCTTSYLVSCLLMRHTIMTEKIARRGVRTPAEYVADALDQVFVTDVAAKSVVALKANQRVDEVRRRLDSGLTDAQHQGFPVLDAETTLVGVVTRRDLLDKDISPSATVREVVKLPPKFVYTDSTVRQAADHMANHNIGRLPIMSHDKPPQLVAIITRSDIVGCFRRTAADNRRAGPTIKFAVPKRRAPKKQEAN